MYKFLILLASPTFAENVFYSTTVSPFRPKIRIFGPSSRSGLLVNPSLHFYYCKAFHIEVNICHEFMYL